MKEKKKRTDLYLTNKQYSEILQEAKEKQITFSERFRQIIENYLENKNGNRK